MSQIFADAEDSSHQHHRLDVEFISQLPGIEWVSLLEVRLDPALGDLGDVLIAITSQGATSNRVRLGIGHVGGGLQDDPGAVPTPARTYAISGNVNDDSGTGLDNVTVTLINGADSSTRTMLTRNGGSFVFADMPPGANYTVNLNDNIFAFPPRTATELNSNLTFTFAGTRRSYKIFGQITDRLGRGVSSAHVTLSGASAGSANSDANGNYSISNLVAGRDYQVSAARTDYFIDPGLRSVHLTGDAATNFTATRFYVLNGKIADAGGQGIFGVVMKLSGPETGQMRTRLDGLYSFTVTTPGDYVLTPSKEQNYYQFSPSIRNLNVSDRQTNNFTADLVINEEPDVLEYSGEPMNVDYSFFWPPDTNVGHFFWEFWAMPGENTYDRYLLTDGYGGAHVILFGFNYGPGRHYTLLGNVWVGNGVYYFNSDDGPSPGEWGHYAVGWDGRSIITYYDGVPVGKQPFTGPRVSTGTYNGATLLMVGGSGHQNFIGRIAEVRGYEENNPHEASPESSFAPETIFSVDGQLLSYYFHPGPLVADLSHGYNGKQHVGWPRGAYGFYFDPCVGCPPPSFVRDPSAPNFLNPLKSQQPVTELNLPPATPNAARVFDSFSRDNSTHILLRLGGLGNTEAGTAGIKAWQTGIDPSESQPFGILSERAVVLSDETAIAWVAAGAADLDVRVDRGAVRFGSGTNTGLSFRVLDRDNFFFAYVSGNPGDTSSQQSIAVGYYQSGSRTIVASGIPITSTDWTTLRAVTRQSGSIDIYVDNSLLFSTASPILSSARGAGLFNNGPGLGLANRWDNFTIFDAR